MNYTEWEASVPAEIREDALWKMKAYRLGLFAAAIGWHDVTKLAGDTRTVALSDQLNRALGSISANIAEGYGRGTGKDRALFYSYALGSARESRDWYYKAQPILGSETVVTHRIGVLTEVIRLLITMTTRQRQGALHEPGVAYSIKAEEQNHALTCLLHDVPLP